MPVGAYPGTFDPPTVAHLAIAEAALEQGELDEVHLVVSVRPLGKQPAAPSFEDRIAVLEAVAGSRPWMRVTVSSHRLIADVVAGYDAVIMGADKWLQVVDPGWYRSERARDDAVRSLPRLLLAERHGSIDAAHLPGRALILEVDRTHREVSSSQVRAGLHEWMLSEAAEFDRRTGAWSDPAAYLARGASNPGGVAD